MKVRRGLVRAVPVVLAFAAGFAILGLGIWQQPGSPMLQPFLVFPHSYQLPSPPISLFARWVPASPGWAWLWHLKEVMTGKIKPVEIDTDIVSLGEGQPVELGTALLSSSGSADAPQVSVWLLEQARLKSVKDQLKTNPGNLFLNSPRIIYGDGIGASLFAGQTIVLNGTPKETGLRVSYLTRVRGQVVDLTASISLVDALTNDAQLVVVRTNLDLKAGFQIPKGKGIFVLHRSDNGTNQARIGLILSTKL